MIPQTLFEYRARANSVSHTCAYDPELRGRTLRVIWEAHAATYAANLGAVAELIGKHEAGVTYGASVVRDELEGLRRQVADIELVLEGVWSSASWRATRPLRTVKRVLGRG